MTLPWLLNISVPRLLCIHVSHLTPCPKAPHNTGFLLHHNPFNVNYSIETRDLLGSIWNCPKKRGVCVSVGLCVCVCVFVCLALCVYVCAQPGGVVWGARCCVCGEIERICWASKDIHYAQKVLSGVFAFFGGQMQVPPLSPAGLSPPL